VGASIRPSSPRRRRSARPRRFGLDAAGRNLVEHVVDECRLEASPALIDVDERFVTANRTDDRRLSCRSVEPVEPEPVREQIRNGRLQGIEPCERVLATPDQHIDPQTRIAKDLCKLFGKATAARVVEEQLLELIEDQIEIAARVCRRFLQRTRKRSIAAAGRFDHGGNRIPRPGGKDDNLYPLLLSKTMSNPGAEHGALADAARAVQHRDASRHEVGGDDLRLMFTPEEQQRVEIGVLEWREALVGGRRCRDEDAHATASAGAIPA
jgi:hypothetical protein